MAHLRNSAIPKLCALLELLLFQRSFWTVIFWSIFSLFFYRCFSNYLGNEDKIIAKNCVWARSAVAPEPHKTLAKTLFLVRNFAWGLWVLTRPAFGRLRWAECQNAPKWCINGQKLQLTECTSTWNWSLCTVDLSEIGVLHSLIRFCAKFWKPLKGAFDQGETRQLDCGIWRLTITKYFL